MTKNCVRAETKKQSWKESRLGVYAGCHLKQRRNQIAGHTKTQKCLGGHQI